jgi:hypothetical protein
MSDEFSCPCCGEKTIDNLGDYEICPICKWEDDPVQYKDPSYSGGANKMSLNEAREAFRQGKKVE